MQCYTELLPPTAVTHSLSLPFLHADAHNLIVVKTSLLQVFDVKSIGGRGRFSLIGEYALSGTVTNIARVKLSDTKCGGDALLVACKDAKLSLVEWDQENYRISTISIHYYEGENVVSLPFGPDISQCENILTVDPNWKCAAFKFGTRQLAVLPFKQPEDELGVEEDEDMEPASATLKKIESVQLNGDVQQTPYKASFVLSLSTLLEDIRYTVDLGFLHGYREATLGILSASQQPSTTLLDERKDVLEYRMFKLELEQGESTELQVVKDLPNTLWRVLPLPAPIGGALLVGTNSLIHIDQDAKVNAVAVNEFSVMETSRGMQDQSDLHLKLERCSIEVMDQDSRQLLLVLNDGALATITFKFSGRNIIGMQVAKVDAQHGGGIVKASPSCISTIDDGIAFVGSEDGPSSLISWSRATTASQGRKRSHAQMLRPAEDDDDEEVIDEDDDDLYDAAPEAKKRATSTEGNADTRASFALKDELRSIGPINDICLGRPGSAKGNKLELALGTGRGRSSRLTCLHKGIVPRLARSSALQGAKSVWALHVKSGEPEDAEYDNLIFAYDGLNTKIYDVDDVGYMERIAQEFESEGETLEVQTVAGDSIIVQCRRSEIRTYDTDLALSQIIPQTDEETDEDLSIVHISFCDPYLLVVRDDSSVQVLQVQGKEIEALEGEGEAAEKKWLSGSIYAGDLMNSGPVLFLLSSEGTMNAFSLPDLQTRYSAPALPHLPPVLTTDAPQRRAGTKETLTELLVADLGANGVSTPHLIVRTALDHIVLYEPFHYPASESSWYTNLRWRKVPLCYTPKYNEAIAQQETSRPPPLKAIGIHGDYNAVAIPGSPPLLLMKESTSLPKVLEVTIPREENHVFNLAPIHLEHCKQGLAAISTEGVLEEYELASSQWYGTGWSVQQVDLGEDVEVRHMTYHETRGVYVVATCRYVDFYFAEDDLRHLGQDGRGQDDIELRPKIPQYSVHIISAKTHRILNTHTMGYLETITSLKIMPLEVSENTHEQQLRVIVATAAERGEDMPAKGAVTVLNIIDVVPEPDVEESGLQFHVDAREESRGAITALAPFAGGFIGTAQGQKIMIRGLKEDGTCLPVAFLDTLCHATTIKTLGTKGMWLLGDAWKGLWFGGFTEEPYKLTVLGKSPKTKMEVVSADFLPFDGALYILVVDADMDLHVLQYDPENPKTVNGLRLLQRGTFHLGHFCTSMTLLPSTLKPFAAQQRMNGEMEDFDSAPEDEAPLFHILTTTLEGSVGLVTPLDESAYRRMSALQTQLTNVLEHACGLNPRAYRVRSLEAESFGGAKGIVDGNVVRRIGELGAARRADLLGRAGSDMWTVRSDLEVVGGGGLGYL